MHKCAQGIVNGVYIIIMHVSIHEEHEHRGTELNHNLREQRKGTTQSYFRLIERAMETSGKLRSWLKVSQGKNVRREGRQVTERLV